MIVSAKQTGIMTSYASIHVIDSSRTFEATTRTSGAYLAERRMSESYGSRVPDPVTERRHSGVNPGLVPLSTALTPRNYPGLDDLSGHGVNARERTSAIPATRINSAFLNENKQEICWKGKKTVQILDLKIG